MMLGSSCEHMTSVTTIHFLIQERMATFQLVDKKQVAHTCYAAAKWKQWGWTQLSKYLNQGIFWEPCPHPNNPNAVIIPFGWTYVHHKNKLAHKGGDIVGKA